MDTNDYDPKLETLIKTLQALTDSDIEELILLARQLRRDQQQSEHLYPNRLDS